MYTSKRRSSAFPCTEDNHLDPLTGLGKTSSPQIPVRPGQELWHVDRPGAWQLSSMCIHVVQLPNLRKKSRSSLNGIAAVPGANKSATSSPRPTYLPAYHGDPIATAVLSAVRQTTGDPKAGLTHCSTPNLPTSVDTSSAILLDDSQQERHSKPGPSGTQPRPMCRQHLIRSITNVLPGLSKGSTSSSRDLPCARRNPRPPT